MVARKRLPVEQYDMFSSGVWDEWTCNYAMKSGNLYTYDWAIANGCVFEAIQPNYHVEVQE